jgi:hypothetical protein
VNSESPRDGCGSLSIPSTSGTNEQITFQKVTCNNSCRWESRKGERAPKKRLGLHSRKGYRLKEKQLYGKEKLLQKPCCKA